MVMDELSSEMGAVQSTATGVVSLILSILLIVAWWKVFNKAGEAGWKAIIPIYNTYTLVKIADGKGIKFLLLLIPIVDIIYGIMLANRLSKAFGKSTGFTLGLIFLSPIFMLILGFGDAQYQGPQGN